MVKKKEEIPREENKRRYVNLFSNEVKTNYFNKGNEDVKKRIEKLWESIPLLRNRIVSLTDDIESIENKGGLRQRLVKEFSDLLSSPDILKIEVSGEEVIVYTDLLFCWDSKNKVYRAIGKFKITLDRSKKDKDSEGVYWKNLTDPRKGLSDSGLMQAPHIYPEGYACLGNRKSIFRDLLQEREYASAIDLAIQFVQYANVNDSAGKYVDQWPEATSQRNAEMKRREKEAEARRDDNYELREKLQNEIDSIEKKKNQAEETFSSLQEDWTKKNKAYSKLQREYNQLSREIKEFTVEPKIAELKEKRTQRELTLSQQSQQRQKELGKEKKQLKKPGKFWLGVGEFFSKSWSWTQKQQEKFDTEFAFFTQETERINLLIQKEANELSEALTLKEIEYNKACSAIRMAGGKLLKLKKDLLAEKETALQTAKVEYENVNDLWEDAKQKVNELKGQLSLKQTSLKQATPKFKTPARKERKEDRERYVALIIDQLNDGDELRTMQTKLKDAEETLKKNSEEYMRLTGIDFANSHKTDLEEYFAEQFERISSLPEVEKISIEAYEGIIILNILTKKIELDSGYEEIFQIQISRQGFAFYKKGDENRIIWIEQPHGSEVRNAFMQLNGNYEHERLIRKMFKFIKTFKIKR
ncbi:MAG: hypothetical protein LBD11_04125 [Candidatus Peribacteria bacterium]|jgi:hypothetical protein|nr:hypothetical protein [Candidatus Peribacteria bacterium]